MNKLKSMFTTKLNQLRNLVAEVKLFKQAEHRKQRKIDLKYRLFLFERRWQLHPVFRFTYPKPGLPRKIAVGVMALLITTTGFLIYVNQQAQADWYSTGWVYRKQITINSHKVSSTQTDFPVLINIADTSLAANSLGNDILFTDSDGTTKLSHEIESYATASGELVAWVKVPTVSSTSDTVIYMYYGNPSATDQQNRTGTWNTNCPQ